MLRLLLIGLGGSSCSTAHTKTQRPKVTNEKKKGGVGAKQKEQILKRRRDRGAGTKLRADSVVKDRKGKKRKRAVNWVGRRGVKYEPDIDGEVKHNQGASAA